MQITKNGAPTKLMPINFCGHGMMGQSHYKTVTLF